MSSKHLVFLSVPGLRRKDLNGMPQLSRRCAAHTAGLNGTFPCVTWPAQATQLTGTTPSQHGVIGNGFYWRDEDKVEMWTASNEVIEKPQIWDQLHAVDGNLRSAVWFPMLSKRCGADYVCMPAPVHNPDGSESLWCYTKPESLYGELRDQLGHFPLQHFWGPLAGIASTDWIVDSAIVAMTRFRPNFFYIYLPHLDYAAQKHGPDSPQANAALGQLDEAIGRLAEGIEAAIATPVVWCAASEYTIQPIDHVTFPNRVLREAGYLSVRSTEEGEMLDTGASQAWCLVDHQFSHVFVRDRSDEVMRAIAELFRQVDGIDEVLDKAEQTSRGIAHARSGDLVLISQPHSWQAYYWWLDDAQAPEFARTVDIHRKPGYDPVELCFDPIGKCIPLDATLIRGSHGVPVSADQNQSVWISSDASLVPSGEIRDVEIAEQIVGWFGGA